MYDLKSGDQLTKVQIKPAARLGLLPPYLFAELDRLKKEVQQRGVDVISLGIGDPDLPTPAHIIARLQAAVAESLKSAEVVDKLTGVSAGYIVGSTPEQFAVFIRAERAKWAKVIKQAGIKLEL